MIVAAMPILDPLAPAMAMMPLVPPPPKPAPSVLLEPHGRHVRLVRAGAVYAVPTGIGEELRGVWCSPAQVPEGYTPDLTPREAGLLCPLLRGLAAGGRQRAEALTEDGKLMDRAIEALGGVTLKALAAKIGISLAQLSRARTEQGPPLPPDHVVTLKAIARGETYSVKQYRCAHCKRLTPGRKERDTGEILYPRRHGDCPGNDLPAEVVEASA